MTIIKLASTGQNMFQDLTFVKVEGKRTALAPPILMGLLCASSLGVADFIASQSSERIGAKMALVGMLFVSTIILTGLMILQSEFDDLFTQANQVAIAFAVLHGATMAIALVLFFHAMAIGKVSMVAPIIAAHPLIIVLYSTLGGVSLGVLQLLSIAVILIGVSLVASSDHSSDNADAIAKTYAPWQKVVMISILASIIYGIAIIFLQEATQSLSSLQILWFGRSVGLLTIVIILAATGWKKIPISKKWLSLFLLHGALDSGGLLFLLWGTHGGSGDVIVAVLASIFPVITVLIAWLILKERIGFLQFVGTSLVLIGVSVLSAA